MIYLYMAEKVTDTDYIINGIHNFPFDEVHGLGKSEDELKAKGYLVEELPMPNQTYGKKPVLHINPNTKELWYTYEDTPQEKKIAEIEQKSVELEAALMELTMLVAGGNA
ncbi:hypothetical protein K7T73_12875 [Bacillus badius]|uniref:hypothetical protein n=1 Tax=Bacillus badius TaxID=1455 RepID=UPI001CBC36AE|nr:hypothetical protein [Bacillus badius]UAT29493.1 hypothetical protein K7T73_12875 [Bacillus badius]